MWIYPGSAASLTSEKIPGEIRYFPLPLIKNFAGNISSKDLKNSKIGQKTNGHEKGGKLRMVLTEGMKMSDVDWQYRISKDKHTWESFKGPALQVSLSLSLYV